MNVNQLPQYKCHKVVRAGKISEVDIITEPDLTGEDRPEPVQGAFLTFDNYPPVTVDADFVSRHQPQVGGYLVAYEDGYLSYSPAAAFEAGYHLLELGSSSGSTDDAAPATTGFKWRKKPVVIEAFQLNEHSLINDAPEWAKKAIKAQTLAVVGVGKVAVITFEGVMTAEPGDWIIRGVKGELYPCKPDIFAATYEPADTAPATNMVGATGGPEALPVWVGVDLAAADFSDALMWLKEGKRVARAGWKGRYLSYLKDSGLLFIEKEDGSEESRSKYDVIVHNSSIEGAKSWFGDSVDLTATDWQVVG